MAIANHKSIALIKTALPILLLITFSHTTKSSPIREESKCGPAKCTIFNEGYGGEKFLYRTGHIYLYKYTVNNTVSVEGGPSRQSGIHLSASASLKFQSPCEAILLMKDVELHQSTLEVGQNEQFFKSGSGKDHLAFELEQYPLRFSWSDGLIEEICPDVGESPAVLNIKRGVLSALQNTMKRLDLDFDGVEGDVQGKCKVQYRLGLATSSTMTVIRKKDVNSCGDKFGIKSSVHGMPYNFGALHQSMPAVTSTSECEQTVDRNLLSSVSCFETHRLRSLARGAAGAYTKIHQSLKLESDINPLKSSSGNKRSGSRNRNRNRDDMDDMDDDDDDEDNETDSPGVTKILDAKLLQLISKFSELPTELRVLRRESLLFQHHFHQSANDFPTFTTSTNTNSNIGIKAKSTLSKFCQYLLTQPKENNYKEVGSIFEELVGILRQMNYNELDKFSKEAPVICPTDRRPFDDALEAMGTSASISIMKDKILKSDAPPETIESWIASFAYIQNPDLSILNSALEILRSRDVYPNILLSYSTLAHRFCQQNPGCEKHTSINKLTRLYEIYFNYTKCSVKNPKEIENTLMYLKGLGNFGQHSDKIEKNLENCIENGATGEIQISAIEALRRMPCGVGNEILRKIFEDAEKDSEIRIEAFLSLMKCPNYEAIRWLRGRMQVEQVNQVGSFIWTWVKNMQETALPSKIEIQGLLADEKFARKFPIDIRRFSRPFEISTFYDDYNLGAGLDGNLIYSQFSYLPRSTMLNMTVDLFGESINVFEAKVRTEHFEHYIESIFGPKGPLNSPQAAAIVAGFRKKRSIPTKRRLKSFALENEAFKRYYSQPMVSLSLKTFGNEILFWRKVGVEPPSSFNFLNPIHQILNKNVDLQRSQILLDSSYIIPTGVGLPLNLSATASSVYRFQVSSSVSTNTGLDFSTKLEPSAIISVQGSMTINVGKETTTGIQVRASLRSSIAVESQLQIQGTKLLKAEFGLPKSRLDLLEYKSDLIFLQHDGPQVVGQLPPLNSLSMKPLCTGGLLGKTIGLRLCRTAYFSLSPGSNQDNSLSPYFPLNGPSQFLVTVEKGNPRLTKTRIQYEYYNTENSTKLTSTYETVESGISNTIGLNIDMDKVLQNFQFSFKLPENSIEASGYVRHNGGGGDGETNGKFELVGTSGRSKILEMGASFTTSSQSQESKVKNLVPKFWVLMQGKKYIDGKGEIILQNQMENGGISFKGAGDMKLWDGRESNIDIHGLRNVTDLDISITADYKSLSSKNKETVQFIAKTGGLGIDDVGQFDQIIQLYLSEYPQLNIDASMKYRRDEEGIESQMEISTLGTKFNHKFIYWITPEMNRFKCLFGLVNSQIEYLIDTSLVYKGNSIDSNITLLYGPGNKFQSTLFLEKDPGFLTEFHLGWNVTLPNQIEPFRVGLDLRESSHRVYEGKFFTDWFSTKSLLMEMEYSDKSKRYRIHRAIQLAIQTKSFDKLKIAGLFILDDKNSKFQITSEYKDEKSKLELGHVQQPTAPVYGGYCKLIIGSGHDYSINATLDRSFGWDATLLTNLGSKLPDFDIKVKATERNGLEMISISYNQIQKGMVQMPKIFLLEMSKDTSRYDFGRLNLILTAFEHNVIIDGEYQHEKSALEIRNRIVLDNKEQLKLNLGLKLRPVGHGYDLYMSVVSPLHPATRQNATLSLGLHFVGEKNCLISVDGDWGDGGILQGSISTEMSQDRKEENNLVLNLTGKFSSSLKELDGISISMHHTHTGPLNVKTDLDIQLPEKREINLSLNWSPPSRAELHIKSPFKGYQNLDIQWVIGHQDNSEMLVVAGLYLDGGYQYSIEITGTPRFDLNDGAVRFEISSSNARFEKVFGSLSYAFGDSSRVACQLGWPGSVVNLETGLELGGGVSEEFRAYTIIMSPWAPIRKINTLARYDSTQAEVKADWNEDGISAKCEWFIESPNTFDIRFDSSTPFHKVSSVLKNSFFVDDTNTFHSQAQVWFNEEQMGFKFEGGISEIEEEETVALITNASAELYTLVYPMIRGSFNLAQRDTKFNLDLSLKLKPGPINLSGELDLLDMFRFNEKLKITTPFPGLMELEINLQPAIIPDSQLYNLDLGARWRASEWHEGGVTIRYGNQNSLAEALAQDLEAKGDYDEPPELPIVPTSQLFHWFFPIPWARDIRLEYQLGPENDNPEIDEGPLPLGKIEFDYRGDIGQLETRLKNELLNKLISASIDLPLLNDPVHLKFEGSFDSHELDRKLRIFSAWAHQESSLISSWQLEDSNFMKIDAELRTPWDHFELQSANIKYNRNTQEQNLDVKLGSMMGKLESMINLGPRFCNLHLISPFEGFRVVTLRADVNPIEGSSSTGSLNTVVSAKADDKEIQIDVETRANRGWPSSIKGTVKTTNINGVSEEGKVEAALQKNSDEVKGDGQIEWGKRKLVASTFIKLSQGRIAEMTLKVDSPFKGYEVWEFWSQRSGKSKNDQSLKLILKSPLDGYEDLRANITLRKGGSFLEVKRLVFQGKARENNSINLSASWKIEEWHNMELKLDSRITGENHPTPNTLKFTLKNLISSAEDIDSSLYLDYGTTNPLTRLGGEIRLEELDDSVDLKLKAYLPQNKVYNLDYRGNVQSMDIDDDDDELFTRNATISIIAEPQNRKIQAFLQVSHLKNSLGGEALINWGEDLLANLHSHLNCTFPSGDGEVIVLHLDLSRSIPPFGNVGTTGEQINKAIVGENSSHDKISIDGTFDKILGKHRATLQGQVRKKEIKVDLALDYIEFEDLAGSLNMTVIPDILSLDLWLENKVFMTSGKNELIGKIGGKLDDETMAIKYSFNYESNKLSDELKIEGNFSTLLPFNQANSSDFQGRYETNPMRTENELRFDFNDVQLVQCKYRYKTHSSAGIEKEQRDFTLDNHFWPFGLTQVYKYEYSGGYAGENYPVTESHLLEVYNLAELREQQKENFDRDFDLHKLGLGGELKIRTTFNGREITLAGEHPATAKRIQLFSNYAFLNHRFEHLTNFTWRSEAWFAYEFSLINLTNVDKTEHRGVLTLSYPIRVIKLDSSFQVRRSSLQIDSLINWNALRSPNRDLETQMRLNGRELIFTLKHPSLAKKIELGGQLVGSDECKLYWDYSGDPKRMLVISGRLHDDTKVDMGQQQRRGQIGGKNYNINNKGGSSSSTSTRKGNNNNFVYKISGMVDHQYIGLDLKASQEFRDSPQDLSIISLIDFKHSIIKNSKPESRSKLALELFKDQGKLNLLVDTPRDKWTLSSQLIDKYPLYIFEVMSNSSKHNEIGELITGQNEWANLSMNFEIPYFKLYSVKELSNGSRNGSPYELFGEGGLVDSRYMWFDISESHENFRFSDLNFFLRINHSKLITSRLKWRPDLFSDLQEGFDEKLEQMGNGLNESEWIQGISDEFHLIIQEIWADAKTALDPLIREMRTECNFTNDTAALKHFFTEIHDKNEFYVKDITSFLEIFAEEMSVKFSTAFIQLREYREKLVGKSSKFFEKCLIWFLESVQESYREFSEAMKSYRESVAQISRSTSSHSENFRKKLSLCLYKSLNFVISIGEEVYKGISALGQIIGNQLNIILDSYKPALLTIYQKIETYIYRAIVGLSDYLYEAKDEVVKSYYWQKLSNLADDIDQLYKDLLQNDTATNIRKYYTLVRNFISKKMIDVNSTIYQQWTRVWNQMEQIEIFEGLKIFTEDSIEKLWYIAEYLNLDESFQELLVILYTKGGDLLHQTVLQASDHYQEAKTKFIFDTDRGLVELEQKLPMPWPAFNETPKFMELPEYQNMLKMVNLFRSETSLWNVYRRVGQASKITHWFPPFDGQALLVGSEHFLTFDGLSYSLPRKSAACSAYLLVGDLVDGNFSLSIQYEESAQVFQLIVTSGHNSLIIDLNKNNLRDPKRGDLSFPVQMQHLQGYLEGTNIVVETTTRGLIVICNTEHNICKIMVSGWYSRKVGGLLGTMDDEYSTDLVYSGSGKLATLNDVSKMAITWDVSDPAFTKECTPKPASLDTTLLEMEKVQSSTKNTCEKIFQSRYSPLQPCFSTVGTDPFYKICSNNPKLLCSTATSYAVECSIQEVKVSLPSICAMCNSQFLNKEDKDEDSTMFLGDFKKIEQNSIKSTDIVLLVEAKLCNRNLRMKKKLDVLLTSIDNELKSSGFSDNRYSVMLFGGDGVYQYPHLVIANNTAFTSSVQEILPRLNNLPGGNGPMDIFGAIRESLYLEFRPGVSKTIILFPCSSCQPEQMTIDFSTIKEALLERDAVLHILMNEDFFSGYGPMGKRIFGMDNNKVYTKEDGAKGRKNIGDITLRSKIINTTKKISYHQGFCGSLVLQTNGTIFNGKKLQNKREKVIQVFSTAFSRRIVQTSQPSSCQVCICKNSNSSKNNKYSIGEKGIIECFLCNSSGLKSSPKGDSVQWTRQSGPDEKHELEGSEQITTISDEDDDE